MPSVSPGAPPGEVAAANAAAGGQETGGAVTLSQIIPDERTNKLIIVASPAAFERILQIVKEVDVPTDGGGRINVYPLENADAEDRAYHDITPEKILDWARDKLAELEQVDRDFGREKGRVFVGKL